MNMPSRNDRLSRQRQRELFCSSSRQRASGGNHGLVRRRKVTPTTTCSSRYWLNLLVVPVLSTRYYCEAFLQPVHRVKPAVGYSRTSSLTTTLQNDYYSILHSTPSQSPAEAYSPRDYGFNSTIATEITAEDYQFQYRDEREEVQQQHQLQDEDTVALLHTGVQRKKASSVALHRGQAGTYAGAATIAVDVPKNPAIQKVYCDLDGVLVDFVAGIRELFTKQAVDQYSQVYYSTHRHNLMSVFTESPSDRRYMWEQVARTDSFFEHLPWTVDGRELWEAIAPLKPDILTGVPANPRSSRLQKYRWCQRELLKSATNTPFHKLVHVDMAGPWNDHAPANQLSPRLPRLRKFNNWFKVLNENLFQQHSSHQPQKSSTEDDAAVGRVITCWSMNKHYESGPGKVLIDDSLCLKEAWEAKGGIFIHHQPRRLEHTLQQLRDHGVLPPKSEI